MAVLAGITFTAGALLCGSLYLLYRQRKILQTKQLQRAEDELHPQLKQYTTFRSYTTPHAHYSHIRTFYRPHSHRDKHVDIEDLPLLVFIHGLGGVLPQFAPLLQSLTNIGPCVGLELPGHGRSNFEHKNYEAYTIEANAALWKTAIEEVCQQSGHKSVVIIGEWYDRRWRKILTSNIGHSMGCSISALLASQQAESTYLDVPVLGMVSICPRARPLTEEEIKAARTLIRTPDFVINILRWFDRRGGINSRSVRRVIGDMKEPDLKYLQLQWNRQSKTQVLKRVTAGLLPRPDKDGVPTPGYPSRSIWQGVNTPLLLIAGKSDHVTPASGVSDIVQYMSDQSLGGFGIEPEDDKDDPVLQATNGLVPKSFRRKVNGNSTIIQTIVLPEPASHALLYAHTTYRLISALVESFLAKHVSKKLDFSYQLRLLTTSGKWDVKNLAKWKAVLPVSGPINT